MEGCQTAILIAVLLAIGTPAFSAPALRNGFVNYDERQCRLAIEQSVDSMEKALAHNNLGVLYLQENENPAKRMEFSAAIAPNPNEFNSFLGPGGVEQQASNHEAAIPDFTRACQLTTSPIEDFWLGQACEEKGTCSRAQNVHVAALHLAPGMGEAQSRHESARKRTEGTVQ